MAMFRHAWKYGYLPGVSSTRCASGVSPAGSVGWGRGWLAREQEEEREERKELQVEGEGLRKRGRVGWSEESGETSLRGPRGGLGRRGGPVGWFPLCVTYSHGTVTTSASVRHAGAPCQCRCSALSPERPSPSHGRLNSGVPWCHGAGRVRRRAVIMIDQSS
eukprot:774760-Rhodomonas_salina.2